MSEGLCQVPHNRHIYLALCRAPFRTACRNSDGEVRCPRADFFASPLPGGFGSPVDRHKDRSARSVLNRGMFFLSVGETGETPVSGRRGKPGSGAEPSG